MTPAARFAAGHARVCCLELARYLSRGVLPVELLVDLGIALEIASERSCGGGEA